MKRLINVRFWPSRNVASCPHAEGNERRRAEHFLPQRAGLLRIDRQEGGIGTARARGLAGCVPVRRRFSGLGRAASARLLTITRPLALLQRFQTD
jgi:hypothetical protein